MTTCSTYLYLPIYLFIFSPCPSGRVYTILTRVYIYIDILFCPVPRILGRRREGKRRGEEEGGKYLVYLFIHFMFFSFVTIYQ
ncbi:hypothetical protein F5X96DRAFT_615751 [Biscogniauxia mediterranea]|nr:hypothetical protein F5X96DRAFT_615751 [Biscogniauxia mediterranea]